VLLSACLRCWRSNFHKDLIQHIKCTRFTPVYTSYGVVPSQAVAWAVNLGSALDLTYRLNGHRAEIGLPWE